jgi:hypothetical protein
MAGFNHFNEIAEKLETAESLIVRKTAFDIQANYVANAAVATGFMKSSPYVVTSDSSTYGQAGTPPKGAYLLPPVEAPTSKTTAYIGVGANYAIYVEEGTRYQAAQPAFYPAVEAARQPFQAALDAIESQLGGI